MSKNLMPGETLVLKAHQHVIVLVKPLLIPLLLVVAALVYDLIPNLRNRELVTLIAVAVALLVFILVYIRWSSRSFTITDRRVLLNTGVFSRNSKVIALDRVQDISTNQSILGRMFNYGRIEIDSAGAAGAEVLSSIPDPQKFRDEVFLHAEHLRTQSAPGSPTLPT